MPNKPRAENPGRVIRFEDALWQKVKELAESSGMTPSQLVRAAVLRYIKRPPAHINQKEDQT